MQIAELLRQLLPLTFKRRQLALQPLDEGVAENRRKRVKRLASLLNGFELLIESLLRQTLRTGRGQSSIELCELLNNDVVLFLSKRNGVLLLPPVLLERLLAAAHLLAQLVQSLVQPLERVPASLPA